jgi:ribosomal protein S17
VYWRDFASTLNYSTDPSKVAAVIRGITREPRPTTNIAIVNADGKVLSTDYKKAIAFRGEYAKVCSNVHNEETRSREYKARHRREKIRVQDYLRKPVLNRLNFHQLS